MQFTVNLPAGQLVRQQTAGRYFLLLDAGNDAAGVEVTLRRGNEILESVTTGRRGLRALVAEGFTAVELRSPSAQRVEIVISDGAVDLGMMDGAAVNATITNAAPLNVSLNAGTPANPLTVTAVSQADVSASTITNGAPVPVGPAAVVIKAANANAKELRFFNQGPAAAAIGGAGLTWANRAIVLQAGDTWLETRAAALSWYGITDAGNTASITTQELSSAAGAPAPAPAPAPAAVIKTTVIGTDYVAVNALATAAGPQDTVIFEATDTTGSGASTHVGLLMPNFVFTNNAGGFVAGPAHTLDNVWVHATIGGNTYHAQLKFAAAASLAVAAGGIVQSDLVSVSALTGGAVTEVAANQVYKFTGRQAFAVGGGVSTVGNGTNGHNTDKALFYSSAAGVTPVGLDTGTISATGGSSFAWHIPRVAAIGKFKTANTLSIIEFGDSITAGVGDPGNPGSAWGSGFASRGRKVGAYGVAKIAGMRWAANGSLVTALNTGGAMPLALLSLFNTVADFWGTNESNSAAEQAKHIELATAAFDAGCVKLLRSSLWPSAASTDAYVTIANQTPGGVAFRAAFEAWAQANTNAVLTRGKYTDYVDWTGSRAPADRTKWNADGVTANLYAWDSIHPGQQGHIVDGAQYNAKLLAIQASLPA